MSLHWWQAHLHAAKLNVGDIATVAGRSSLDFEDPEGQRLALVVDPSAPARPWNKSPVPAEHQLRGLGPITMSVPTLEPTDRVLRGVMNMTRSSTYSITSATDVHVYSMTAGGADTELHVAVQPDLGPTRHGAGGVHHVAFRTPTFAEYDGWIKRLNELGVPNSGPVDRFYFRSLYFREPGGVLFEIATDGPGFATDENAEHLGEQLALPPFLESQRKQIEAGLHPID